MKWPNHWAIMSSNPCGTIWSTRRPLDRESLYFDFQSISEVDNYFYIKSVKWMACYVYMKDSAHVIGKKTKNRRRWRMEDNQI